jgi:hypothetical protein
MSDKLISPGTSPEKMKNLEESCFSAAASMIPEKHQLF